MNFNGFNYFMNENQIVSLVSVEFELHANDHKSEMDQIKCRSARAYT